jgi:hypothetical protein
MSRYALRRKIRYSPTWVLCIAASLLLFLYVMNLRSRFYHNGPDYSVLFWLFGWAAAAGVGLLHLRKWVALVVCSRHRILTGNLQGFANSSGIPGWAVVVKLLFVGVTVAAPIALLRFWNILRW